MLKPSKPCSLRSSGSSIPFLSISESKKKQEKEKSPRTRFIQATNPKNSSIASKSQFLQPQRRDRNPSTNFLSDLRATKKRVNGELRLFLQKLDDGEWKTSSDEFFEKVRKAAYDFLSKSEVQI